MSIDEARYIASCSASCEAVWLRKLFVGLFDVEIKTPCVFYDNHSCVRLFDNPMVHDKLKHIEIQYHYLRDMVQRGAVNLQYIAMDE